MRGALTPQVTQLWNVLGEQSTPPAVVLATGKVDTLFLIADNCGKGLWLIPINLSGDR